MNDNTQAPQQMMSHRPPRQQMGLPRQHPQMMFWPPPPMSYPPFVGPPNPTNVGPTTIPRTTNWKPKKDKRKFDNISNTSGGVSTSVYRPPALNELQNQNRVKAKRFFNPKKKFNNRFAPYAPRNTTSFLIRAKKSGGIASLVSPCPVTPAVLPTPMFSPSREVLGDMAKEEWGVDGYGSMKGLIRLKNGDNEDNYENEDNDESSDSDVEEHVEVERRLDHDLSRFEMINYPSLGLDYNNVLENRVDDQDTHIAHLEEENLILKERLFLMEREMGDLRRRMGYLESGNGNKQRVGEEINEEVVDNVSENENYSESREFMDNRDDGDEIDGKEYGDNEFRDVCMEEFVSENVVDNQSKNENVVVENESKTEHFVENQSKVEIIAEKESKSNENQSKNVIVAENQLKNEIVTDNQSKIENADENEMKSENVVENQLKIENVGEGTTCVEKRSEVNDVVSVEGITNDQAEVENEMKNVDDKNDN